MRISRSWIEDYVDLSGVSNAEFEELVTSRVAEVDDLHLVGAPLKHCRIVKVLQCAAHPSAESLKIATVTDGKEQFTVVCGAANCREGVLTVFAPPGVSVFTSSGKEITVEAREVRGVLSSGVLLSEAELGITSEHEGIIECPSDASLGCLAEELFGSVDTVLEIDNKSLTHRPDLWSHFGFARELSAILKRPLKKNLDLWADDSPEGQALLALAGEGKSRFSTCISSSVCRRFAALEFANVSSATSPLWLRRRLFAVGGGIRNLLVDLSNYVMFDVGQPNHAYDIALLEGNCLEARHARAGESFAALDGENYELQAEDLVIADGSKVVGLAGVMGGSLCSVNSETKGLLLESANFDPVAIRLMAKRHQLRTDASNRFEKSLSQYSVPLALMRYKELLCSIDSGVKVVSAIIDTFPARPEPVRVSFSDTVIARRLGGRVSLEEIEHTLQRLGFKFESSSAACDRIADHLADSASHSALVPYYRATRDISIAEDLIEEVGRIFGYGNLGEDAPHIESSASVLPEATVLEHRLRDYLSGAGFNELYQYSAYNPQYAEKLGFSDEDAVKLVNPVDSTESTMRQSSVPMMISALVQNARFNHSQALFEVGRTYHSRDSEVFAERAALDCSYSGNLAKLACYERRVLSLGYISAQEDGKIASSCVPEVKTATSFYALGKLLRQVLEVVGATEGKSEVKFVPVFEMSSRVKASLVYPLSEKSLYGAKNWMHPGRSAVVLRDNEPLGVIAEVRPEFVEGVRGRVVVAELDLDIVRMIDSSDKTFRHFSRFPDSFFEISLVMNKKEHYGEVEGFLREQVPCEILRGLEVVSVYEGAPLAADEKSLSIKLFLGKTDATLSRDELSSIREGLMRCVDESKYSLRR